MRVHVLNQYMWPDCAPVAIYAEQLGVCFQRNGFDITMVSGSGSYRAGTRPKPDLSYRKLPTLAGKRGNAASMMIEYQSVFWAFKRYIKEEVQKGDIVFCTAAPLQTIHLIKPILQRGAKGIYRLEDYYPDLLRGYIKYPWAVRQMLASHWNRLLSKWHRVGKIAANLDYNGPNVSVLRNWATLDLGDPQPFDPKTAYYFGNLGYAHCHKYFIQTCTELHRDGYTINFVGDGPKVSKLPSWINRIKAPDEKTLADLHWRAEIHLIAGDPEITGAIFPSKYWNSRYTGRKIIASGFSGAMLDELNEANALKKLPAQEDWLNLFQDL